MELPPSMMIYLLVVFRSYLRSYNVEISWVQELCWATHHLISAVWPVVVFVMVSVAAEMFLWWAARAALRSEDGGSCRWERTCCICLSGLGYSSIISGTIFLKMSRFPFLCSGAAVSMADQGSGQDAAFFGQMPWSGVAGLRKDLLSTCWEFSSQVFWVIAAVFNPFNHDREFPIGCNLFSVCCWLFCWS